MTEPTGLATRDSDKPVPLVERTFEVVVSLSPEEILEKFKAHPQLEWHDEAPNPFFAERAYQGWGNTQTIYVRRLEFADKLAAPELELEITEQDQGTRVFGRFHPINNVRKGLPKSVAGRVGLGMGLFALVAIDIALFFGLSTIGAGAVAWGGAAWVKQRERQALAAHGPALLGLVGGILLPHEIGEGDSPFRAPPPGSTR